MKHFMLSSFVLILISCGNGGTNSGSSGGAVHSLDGMQTESLAGGVTRAFNKDGDGNMVEEGYLVNGVRNGMWIKYYTDKDAGKVKSIASYTNGNLNGPYYEFNNRMQVDTEVNYADNVYHGKVAKYKFGRPETIKTYKHNKLDGPSYDYFGDGKLQKETNFKDGKQHGIMTWYNEGGAKTMEYEYKNGEKVSGGIVKNIPD